MNHIVVNTRALAAQLTGSQRYLAEVLKRMDPRLPRIEPRRGSHGIRGHLWEQTVLPFKVRHRVLWSPANTGPLYVKRQVLTILDLAPLDHPEWFTATFAGWYRWLLPRLVKRVAKVITISDFSKERIVEVLKLSAEKVAVVPPGVDARFARVPSDEVAKVIRGLGIPSTSYLLTVGSLEPRKNLTTLFRAWRHASESLSPDTWLVVVGAKGAPRIFREESHHESAERVYFAGYVADRDLPALYSGATMLVYPSLYEGFGLPPLEAMASGTAVITAASGAVAEVVGNAGVRVNVRNAEEIASAIGRIASDAHLRSALELGGLQRARDFNWERTATATWDLLRETAAH